MRFPSFLVRSCLSDHISHAHRMSCSLNRINSRNLRLSSKCHHLWRNWECDSHRPYLRLCPQGAFGYQSGLSHNQLSSTLQADCGKDHGMQLHVHENIFHGQVEDTAPPASRGQRKSPWDGRRHSADGVLRIAHGRKLKTEEDALSLLSQKDPGVGGCSFQLGIHETTKMKMGWTV